MNGLARCDDDADFRITLRHSVAIHTVQFSAEMTTSDGKTTTTLIPFQTNQDYRERLLINKNFFHADHCTVLCYETLLPQICILRLASHNQLHTFGFSAVVNLLMSSPDTTLHL